MEKGFETPFFPTGTAHTHRRLPEIYEKLTSEEVCEVERTVFAAEPTVSVIRGEMA